MSAPGTPPNATPRATVSTSKVLELQRLLKEEHERSEQRKSNYQVLKSEHVKLQNDFLAIQSELKNVLEETKLVSDKKSTDIAQLRSQLESKDQQIADLKRDIAERDPSLLKAKFSKELQEPIKRLEKERDQLERDNERLNYDLRMAKQQVEHAEKEVIDQVERTRLSYEAEINLVRKEKEELRAKFVELSNMPDSAKILSLIQENTKLKAKLNTFQDTCEEAENHLKKFQAKLDELVAEHEQAEANHAREMEAARSALSAAVDQAHQIDDRLRSTERTAANERSSLETRIKEHEDERRKLRSENEHLMTQVKTYTDQRLTVEKELMIANARLEVSQSNQEEIARQRKLVMSLQDELNKARCEILEQTTIAKELSRQKDRAREDYNRIKSALESERKELTEYKVTADKNVSKLRGCLEEERTEARSRLATLEEELARKRREKDDLKAKCRKYAAAAEMAEARMLRESSLLAQQMPSMIPSGYTLPKKVYADKSGARGNRSDYVTPEAHRQLKKQYKELRNRQQQFASLLNCSFEGSDCTSLSPPPNDNPSKHDHHHHQHPDQQQPQPSCSQSSPKKTS